MQPFTFFAAFVVDVWSQVHDVLGAGGVDAGRLAIALTARQPVAATDAALADLEEIPGGHGYTSGGVVLANVGTRTGTTLVVTGPDLAEWVSALQPHRGHSPVDRLVAP